MKPKIGVDLHGTSHQDIRSTRHSRCGTLDSHWQGRSQLASTPITPEPRPRILAEQTLVIRPRSSRGDRSLYERYNVHDPNAMRENMYKEKWELGYFYHRISLSSPRGRGRPAPRLLCCSGLSRCSCLLLLPRFNPFGLPDWSPLRVSYGKESQIQDGGISPRGYSLEASSIGKSS